MPFFAVRLPPGRTLRPTSSPSDSPTSSQQPSLSVEPSNLPSTVPSMQPSQVPSEGPTPKPFTTRSVSRSPVYAIKLQNEDSAKVEDEESDGEEEANPPDPNSMTAVELTIWLLQHIDQLEDMSMEDIGISMYGETGSEANAANHGQRQIVSLDSSDPGQESPIGASVSRNSPEEVSANSMSKAEDTEVFQSIADTIDEATDEDTKATPFTSMVTHQISLTRDGKKKTPGAKVTRRKADLGSPITGAVVTRGGVSISGATVTRDEGEAALIRRNFITNHQEPIKRGGETSPSRGPSAAASIAPEFDVSTGSANVSWSTTLTTTLLQSGMNTTYNTANETSREHDPPTEAPVKKRKRKRRRKKDDDVSDESLSSGAEESQPIVAASVTRDHLDQGFWESEVQTEATMEDVNAEDETNAIDGIATRDDAPPTEDSSEESNVVLITKLQRGNTNTQTLENIQVPAEATLLKVASVERPSQPKAATVEREQVSASVTRTHPSPP